MCGNHMVHIHMCLGRKTPADNGCAERDPFQDSVQLLTTTRPQVLIIVLCLMVAGSSYYEDAKMVQFTTACCRYL